MNGIKLSVECVIFFSSVTKKTTILQRRHRGLLGREGGI